MGTYQFETREDKLNLSANSRMVRMSKDKYGISGKASPVQVGIF